MASACCFRVVAAPWFPSDDQICAGFLRRDQFVIRYWNWREDLGQLARAAVAEPSESLAAIAPGPHHWQRRISLKWLCALLAASHHRSPLRLYILVDDACGLHTA